MYYYKLLDINEQGELASPYGKDGKKPYVWKLGEWRKTESFFYASETIVDALSAVWIRHFSVISLVEIKGGLNREKIFTEVICKEMRIAKAFLWPEYMNLMIEDASGSFGPLIIEHISGPFGPIDNLRVAHSSDDYFLSLSKEEKDRWEKIILKEMEQFVPYGK